MLRFTIFTILFSILFSCHPTQEKPKHTFYYWRTEFNLSPKEQKALQKTDSDKLYVRFFDVDRLNNGFTPIGVINRSDETPIGKEIVPVIFIVNRVWKGISKAEIQLLAQKISQLTQITAQQNHFGEWHELQIDSDWTNSTQKEYFHFLEVLKEISGKNITCTIRLHQVKDKEKTGIPPVNKGYLMCYATGSPLENSNKNSILDVQLLKNYLAQLENYPLKMDMAFPIYSWGIITNHLGKKRLINAVTQQELQDNPNFKSVDKNTFKVMNEGFYYGIYMSPNFTIKVEEISPETLQNCLDFIQTKRSDFELIYYHLDERFIKKII
ncbi:hypothetical protein KRX57_03595 [Weeksellaceae bacterium TAE3-ERU29]|nr:hypothetical protein [Weeksellaceae bacterium TAE3-ERU29]